MAKDDDKLIIEIELEDGKLASGFVAAEKVAKKSGRKAGRDFGDSAARASRNSLLSIKNVVLGLGAAFAGAFATREVIVAASQQEDAINKINTSLRTSGEYTKELSQDFRNWADQLQSSSKFSSEQVLELASLGQAYGFNSEQTRRATEAALEFSTVAGISAVEALRRLGRAASGSVGDVARFVPEVSNLTAEQLRAGEAAELFIKKYSGSAKAQLNTFSGSVTSLSNEWGGLLAEVGSFITKTPYVVLALKDISKSMAASAEQLGNYREGFDLISDAVRPAIASLAFLNRAFIGGGESLFSLAESLLRSLRLITVDALNVLVASITDVLGVISRIFGKGNKFEQMMYEFSAGLRQSAAENFNAIGESFSNVFEQNFTDSLENSLLAFDEYVTGFSVRAKALGSEMPEAIKKASKETTDALKKMRDQSNTIMKNGFSRAIAGGIENVVNSLMDGQNAFANFGNFILGTLGDLAIQLGTFFIAQAVAGMKMMALDFTGGMVAGAGLIALGAIMKNFAKQGAATAASGSVMAQTGGQSHGTQTGESNAFGDDEPEIERQAGQQITVNIQGNVLDGDESGLRIVEIINKSIKEQGAVLA